MTTEVTKQKQVAMHTDFFDRTKLAIENGFYLEAIFREYAAIEGRLEVILGILGAPCNKNASPKERKDVDISHRIHCLKRIYELRPAIGTTKLDNEFFANLKAWCTQRNIIVHGFYKNELKYQERSAQNKKLAEDGLILARMLYNEAKRLRRYQTSHSDIDLLTVAKCFKSGCNLHQTKGGN